MNFTPLDLQVWPRGQIFYYFSKMAPTGYSLTVNMDITKFKDIVKTHGYRLFPAYLWLITKELNNQIEFKVAEQEGVLGYYDTLTPLYATFHEDDKTFSLMWTSFMEKFQDFHEAYIKNQENFGKNHGVLAQPQTPPPNAYTVSCIPWVNFSHFAVHSYENKQYYFPSVEAGKIYEENGRLWMPLSVTCHHATTDGYHIHCFIKALQEDMNQFEKMC
jgi:chloramphenicol O-acetyltransferase type A